MDAKARSLSFMAQEGAISVPYFQRRYVWREENWSDLLDDMLDPSRKQFLGSLILKQQRKVSGEAGEVLVIDGQQRLTTLSILLRAAFDSFDATVQTNTLEQINNHLFFKRSIMDSNRLVKLRHSQFDSEHFQEVIEGRLVGSELASIGAGSSSIKRCYKFFRERLASLHTSAVGALFVRMLDPENKYLVLIDLDPDEDEQSIFDTINSAGVRLSAADIVKNALFQRAAKVVDTQELDRLYQNYWNKVFARDEEAVDFWDTPKQTGRLTRDNLEILLHAVAVIKGFFDPDLHTLSRLSGLYKEHVVSLAQSDLVLFLQEIAEYAEIYRQHITSFDRTTVFSFADDSQRLLHVLEMAEISTFHPYVLALHRRYAKEGEVLRKKLRDLERFVVRRFISGAETKSYNKKCLEFLADDSLPATWGQVTDGEFLSGMRRISNKSASLLLFWIELRRRHIDARWGLKELKFSYSLEHVMPQKWEAHWTEVPVMDSSGQVIVDLERAKSERYRAVYELGNMTLLTTSLNSSLRNYSYIVKLQGEGRKKGIRSYADLSITKDDIVDSYDGRSCTWDEAAIRARTRKLGQEALAIWP